MADDLILRCSLHDVPKLAGLTGGWRGELVQKTRGPLLSDLLLFQSGPLQVLHSTYNQGMIHAGEVPAGRRNIIVQLGDHAPYPLYGSEFAADEIGVMPSSREMDAVSPPDMSNMNISLPSEDFYALTELWGCGGLLKKMEHGGTFRPSPASLAELKGVLRRMSAHVRQGCGIYDFALIRTDIMTALADCFRSVSEVPDCVPPDSRSRIVRRAYEFVRECDGQSPTLADLCGAVGVSERTLLYAFRQRLGLSPKSFVKNFRLDRMREELLNSVSGRVTDIAIRWGFWHMGQLGVDYKRQFGELPSEALRREPTKAQFLFPSLLELH